MLVSLTKKIASKVSAMRTTPATRRMIAHNERVFGKKQCIRKSRPVVLLEFNGMQSAHIAYSYLANVLSAEHKADIKAFLPRILGSQTQRGLFLLGKISLPNDFGVYSSFGTTSFLNINLTRKQEARAAELCSEILPQLENKWDLEALRINGIWVGDLFYDSYLMDYKRATFDRESPEFQHALLESIGLFVFWEDYFAENDVRAVNVSHCVYNLAIPLRIAVHRNIPAYQANIHHLYRLDSKNLFAYNDFFHFREIFARLPSEMQAASIEAARERIERRFSGEVGVDMIYSTKSAYGSARHGRLLRESPRKKILIATHCFFDSPHSYGNNIFPDFYEWLDFLGKMTQETDYDWYIKTHPDFLPGTMEIIRSFAARYPKFTLLPADASHHQIIEEGINAVLTVYGTIAFEYAALGIPVINASQNNPHIAYNFNLHAKNVEDYQRLIHGIQEMRFPIDVDSVYEYYFMKNQFFSWDIFFKSFDETVASLGGYNNLFTTLVYDRWIQEWTQGAHDSIMSKLIDFVRSNSFRFAPRELKYLMPKAMH